MENIMSWWLEYYRNWAQDKEASLQDASAASEAAFIAKALGLTQPKTVLDLGCGYGRHAIHLAHRGLKVTAVDASIPLLKRAARAAKQHNLPITFVKADLRKLGITGRFDGAFFAGATFGGLGDEGDQAALRQISALLKPGARVLIDVANPFADIAPLVESHNRWVDWRQETDHYRLVESEFDVATCTGVFRKTYVTPDGAKILVQRWRAYTCPELQRMLTLCNLSVVHHFGDFDGSPLTLCSSRMIIVAQKQTKGRR
ncbi:MAG: class I SAM-dependent methyltransferase [Phycisphaeraceae bacterium]|nr:class I SAM-dependent methyltransferase [Phycisphaeraceae bacterium]